MQESHTEDNTARFVWIGIAIGATAGIVYAVTRTRKKDRWSNARDITRKLSGHSQDLAERGKELVARMQTIYQEGRKVVEDAADLWSEGRRLVRH